MKHITDKDYTLIDFLANLHPNHRKINYEKMLTEGRIYLNNQESFKAKTTAKADTIEIRDKPKHSDENQLRPEKTTKIENRHNL